jgi:hypothetical protein
MIVVFIKEQATKAQQTYNQQKLMPTIVNDLCLKNELI